jgi:hypothetical protein
LYIIKISPWNLYRQFLNTLLCNILLARTCIIFLTTLHVKKKKLRLHKIVNSDQSGINCYMKSNTDFGKLGKQSDPRFIRRSHKASHVNWSHPPWSLLSDQANGVIYSQHKCPKNSLTRSMKQTAFGLMIGCTGKLIS